MSKTTRIKKKGKGGTRRSPGAAHRIEEFKHKYPDITTTIQQHDRKPGSPAHWKIDYTRQIFWLSLLGITELEMANVIGISIDLFNLWKRRHPDFLNALKAGKTEAEAVATHSLFRSGVGYEHEACKFFPNRVKEYDPKTGKLIKEYTKIIEHTYIKKYPPNVTALKTYLAAKRPDLWGDRSEVRHTGQIEHQIDLSKMSKKQLKLLKKLGKVTQKEINSDKKEQI